MCVCDSQGAELGHVVEAGNRDAADVVVVQRSVGGKKREKEAKTIVTTVKKEKEKMLFKASCVVASVLKHLFKTHVHTRASLRRPAGNITPHSTQMGSPRTSDAHANLLRACERRSRSGASTCCQRGKKKIKRKEKVQCARFSPHGGQQLRRERTGSFQSA